jgi:hypothetical protein
LHAWTSASRSVLGFDHQALVCGELAMFGGSTPAVAHSVAVDVAVTQIAPRLETMNWTVHKFRGPALISSDAPVIYGAGPPKIPNPRESA